MKVAVLCNGPSRSAYDPNKEYAYRIGCNIPWTKVDCTVILDEKVVRLWVADLDITDCPAWFSQQAWDHAKAEGYDIILKDKFLGIIEKAKRGLSSGNLACLKMVELGYTDIDIYGADAFTCNDIRSNTKSYTRNFLPPIEMNMSPDWRTNFNKMIANHPNVKFNFIKGDGSVKLL